MARITISETDLTVSSAVNVLSNVAYVPGLATQGPVNVPTTFTSVDDFTKMFGEKPYQFKSDNVVTYTLKVDDKPSFSMGAGEYDKSYIYAIELLQSGIPVMFERVIDQYSRDDISHTMTVTTLSEDTFVAYKYYIESDNVYTLASEYKQGETYYLSTIIDDTLLLKDFYDVIKGSVEETSSSTNEVTATTSSDNISITGTSADIFANKVNLAPGTYSFTYSDTDNSWMFQSESVDLAEYGLSVNGEPNDGDVIEVTYSIIQGSTTIEYITSAYGKLQDKWTYNIKFITSGGYPTLEVSDDETFDAISGVATRRLLVEEMCGVAAIRGDALALIDHNLSVDSIMDVYNDVNSLFSANGIIDGYYTLSSGVSSGYFYSIKYSTPASRLSETTTKYGTICAPWGIFSPSTPIGMTYTPTIKLPGSFAYLKSYAKAVSVYNSPYEAVAGVVRGLVPTLTALCTDVTGADAENVQVRTLGSVSINPIVRVQGYGLCLWGNRTLFMNTNSTDHPEGDLTASSFLNIRSMSADVKKIIYAACQKYTFETNSTELWLKFKSQVEPTLEQLVASGVLERYDLLRQSTTAKATLSVYVKLYAQYAVEDFEVTVALTDSTVEEE